jgi:hypothetical protein
MNSIISHAQVNIQTVLSSDVLARAVIKAGETRHIISVYAESAHIEFYWVNEEGKRAGTYRKDTGLYNDFASFTQHYAQQIKGTIESSQIYSAELLSVITKQPRHFSVVADWAPRIASTDPRDYEKQNRRLQSKSRHTPASFWSGHK